MAQLMASVARSRKVAEATNTSEEPTPIYLLTELSKMTLEGSDAAASIGDALVKRLANKSPYVLSKALKIIKELCLKGNPEFRRYMQRHAGPVRECQSFRGDPDPLKGERPNQIVRDAAKEATEAVFSSVTASSAPVQGNRQVSGRIQGFGSGNGPGASGGSGGGSGGGGYSSSSSKYVGFGNPNMGTNSAKSKQSDYSQYLNPQTWIDGAQEAVNVANQLITGYHPAQSKATPFLREPASDYHAPGPPAGNTYSSNQSSSNQLKLHYAPSSSGTSAPAPASGGEVLSAEKQLVEGICNGGGVRVQPRPEDLQKFVKSASSLDGEQLARQLLAQLEAGTWQAGLRALCAMEAVLDRGHTASCQALGDYLKQESEPIRKARSSAQSSLSRRADIVYGILFPDGHKSTSSVPAPAPAAQMIDFGAEEPSAAAAASSGVDLLGDLLSDGPAPAAAQPSTPDGMFDGMMLGNNNNNNNSNAAVSVPPSSAPPPPAEPPSSLFDGLNVGAASSAPVSTTAATSSGSVGEIPDLFSSLSTEPMPGAAAVLVEQPAVPSQTLQPGMGMQPLQQQQQRPQMQWTGNPPQQGGMMMGGQMMPAAYQQQQRPGGGMMMMPQHSGGMMPMMGGYAAGMMHPQQGYMMPSQHQQQQVMMGMQPGMMGGMQPGMMMMMPQQFHQQQQPQYQQQQQTAQGMMGGAGSGRMAAPDVFHSNGRNRHASSSTPLFPDKHEPAFDFIGDAIKSKK